MPKRQTAIHLLIGIYLDAQGWIKGPIPNSGRKALTQTKQKGITQISRIALIQLQKSGQGLPGIIKTLKCDPEGPWTMMAEFFKPLEPECEGVMSATHHKNSSESSAGPK